MPTAANAPYRISIPSGAIKRTLLQRRSRSTSISIPSGAIKSILDELRRFIFVLFQFLLVRLRVAQHCKPRLSIPISIPSGAIKSLTRLKSATDRSISIPSGAIKSLLT
jgi:hypothetical protein